MSDFIWTVVVATLFFLCIWLSLVAIYLKIWRGMQQVTGAWHDFYDEWHNEWLRNPIARNR